jgi:hypothetical protein
MACRGRLDLVPQELPVDPRRRNPRCRVGPRAALLSVQVKEAQPRPPDYADPLARTPLRRRRCSIGVGITTRSA